MTKRYQEVAGKRRPAKLEHILKLEMSQAVTPVVLRTVRSDRGVSIDAIDITSGGISLPVWRFTGPGAEVKTRLLLILEPQGRNRAWREGQLCRCSPPGASRCARPMCAALEICSRVQRRCSVVCAVASG